jgi:plastocyanin
MRRSFVALASSVVLVAAIGPAWASPVEVPIATTAESRFVPPEIVIPVGASLRLVQLDPLARHDVMSRTTKRGRPLFGSRRTLSFGESEVVPGVEALKAGSYPFTCSVHEFMNGTLVVHA